VIPFYGKSNEWPTWSDKVLAKVSPYGFKDILLGRSIIPKIDEFFYVESEGGKNMIKVAVLNELTYTE
jgi:hypothetical protein